MTYIDIDKAIVDIVKEKCAECKTRLDRVSKDNPTERKALQLEYGMYSFCGNCGMLFGSGDGSKAVTVRKRFLEGVMDKYPTLYKFYDNLDDEEKFKFIASTQAELYIRDQWLGTQIVELNDAEACGNIAKIFELKIKIGAVLNMFAEWENWRSENSVYPGMFEE